MDADAGDGSDGGDFSGDRSSPISVLLSSGDRPPSAFSLSSLASYLSGGGDYSNLAGAASGGVPHRRLATSMESDDPSSPTPLLAAKCYLLLLLASHSSTSSPLFDPLPFISFLGCLRRSVKRPQSSSPPAVDKLKKRKRGRTESRSSGGFGAEISAVYEIVGLLVKVLGRISLEAHPDARKSVIETIVLLLVSNVVQAAVRERCFQVLGVLMERKEHGEGETTAVDVLRALAPVMLLERKVEARNEAIQFVTNIAKQSGRIGQGVKMALVNLPRFLAMKAPEKVEMRVYAVEVIVCVLKLLEVDDRVAFVEFVISMTRGKARLRLLAVDLILGLFGAMPDPFDDNEGSWGMICLHALVERCSDSSSAIRARALLNLSQVLDSLPSRKEGVALVLKTTKVMDSGFSALLKRRCSDEKAAVRKAGLVLIQKSIALIGSPLDESLLKAMGSACSDPLVSIRKAALTAISEVVRKFSDVSVMKEWMSSVPPLIADNETSIQEECEAAFMELVLNKICQVGNVQLDGETVDTELVLPERILVLLEGISNGEIGPCVKKICSSLGKKKKIRPLLVTSLQNIVTTSESLWLRHSKPINKWAAPPGAWWLLAEVSLFAPKAVNWEFLSHHWQLLDNVGACVQGSLPVQGEQISANWVGDRVSLLQTISNVSLELPVDPAAELAHNLLSRIEKFDMHPSEVDAHVKALRTLCKRKARSTEEGEGLVLKWAQQLLSRAFSIIDGYKSEVSEVAKPRNLFTTPLNGESREKGDKSGSMAQATTAAFTIGSVVLACPAANLQGIIPLLHTIITSAITESRPRKLAGMPVSFKEVAPSLYIHSWSTMAKICLVHDKLAKRYIPLFVQELERSDLAALRNNLMVAMSDFCVRYTALVDRYIPKITKSLCDPCEVVRRQTFILLSKLLQRDYVKWRGVLFLRFLPSLVDSSEKIRHLADYLFGSILKAKAPLLAYNSFIEAIYVLNNCKGHPGTSESQSSIDKLFALRGTDERSQSVRMRIYVCLLRQMAPEHLLATSAKLFAEILGGACDGLLNIDDAEGRAVLLDALKILSCKEMRVHPSICTDNSEIDDDGVDPASSAALAAAKGQAVTQVAKKNLIQIAIPIFIELKRLLEDKRSPLTGSLMECLCVLLKDYKNEFDEILVADKQLQKELLYDMQKYEANKAKSKAAEAVARAQRPSNNLETPGRNASAQIRKAAHKNLDENDRAGMIGSAIADAAARSTVRSLLKGMSINAGTPSLHTMSVPKVKSCANAGVQPTGSRPPEVLQSVMRRHTFEDENDE